MTPEPIVIRRAFPEDADPIWQVRTRAIRELCRTHYVAEEIDTWASTPMPASFANVIRDAEFFVAEHESEIIGHAFLDPSTGEIAAVFVSPDHVRTGVGSLLLATLEQRAGALGLSSLWLSATLNAAAFYSSADYVETGPAEFQHPNGFTLACVKMEKTLEPASRVGH